MDYIGGKIGDLKKNYKPILPLFVSLDNANAGKCVNFGYKRWPEYGTRMTILASA